MTAAWTDTSSAETGSSATTTAGIAAERARDADALLLAARQLPWLAEREFARQLHEIEQLVSLAPRISPRVLRPTPNFFSTRPICARPNGWD